MGFLTRVYDSKVYRALGFCKNYEVLIIAKAPLPDYQGGHYVGILELFT